MSEELKNEMDKLNPPLAKYDFTNPEDLSKVLDVYTGLSLELAWRIANDPDHPMYTRFGFEALKLIVQNVTPKRKEITGANGGPIELSLSTLFYKNTLPSKKEIE